MARLSKAQLKAILGTAVAGGGVAGVLGAAVLAAAAVLSPGSVSLITALGGTLAMGLFGAFTTGGVGTMLALSRSEGSIEDLSVLKCGAMGLLSGGTFPTLAALVTGGFLFPIEVSTLVNLGAFFGIMGGGIAAGLVAVAKDTPAAELESGEGPMLEAPSE